MIELRTLGTLELISAEGAPVSSVLSQPRRTALLCYLALASPHGFQRRDVIVALFWPEHTTEHARHALRQSLYFLRRALGSNAIVSRNDDELALAPDLVRCDASAFELALNEGRLEAAMALYRGDLLPGLHISDAPEFERWLEEERARLKRRAAEAAWRLAEAAQAGGDPGAAAEWVRRAATFAPGDERVLRRQMLLLNRVGDRGAAIRAYENFARSLEREYELETSEESRALVARIRAGQEDANCTVDARHQPQLVLNDGKSSSNAPDPVLGTHPTVHMADGEELVSSAAGTSALTRGTSQRARTSRNRVIIWSALLVLLALVAARTSAPVRQSLWEPARGVRERVMVADFTDLTTDSIYGALVTHILRNELARSPLLSVAGGQTISGALQRMRLGSDTRVRGEIAREVAVREEIKVVVEGDVRSVGNRLAVTASVLEATTGEVIHGAAETARDSTEILAAITRLSNAIRRGIGESLESTEAGVPLWSFTTASLPALRKHMAGIRARGRGEYLRAAELVAEAIALDSGFAHAYVSLAGQLQSAGLPSGHLVRHIARIYPMRDRLVPRERTAIEGHYHLNVTGDLGLAVDAFRRHVDELIQIRESGWFTVYIDLLERNGDARPGVKALDELHKFSPSAPHYRALRARAEYALGSMPRASQLLAELVQEAPEHPAILLLQVGWLADSARYQEAHTVAGRIPRATGLYNDLKLQAEIDAIRGRLAEAVGHLRELQDQALTLGNLAPALEIAAAIGRLRVLSGDPVGKSEVDDLLARHRLDSIEVLSRPYLPLVLFFAETGQPLRARAWLNDYEREFPAEFRGPDRWMLHRARAAVHRASGNLVDALAELRQAARVPAVRVGLFEPPSIRTADHPELARVYSELGSADSAIAVYERYLAVRSLNRSSADAFELGKALEHLALLYDQRGDHVRAAAQYRRLAELWRDADASLQPRAAAARERAKCFVVSGDAPHCGNAHAASPARNPR